MSTVKLILILVSMLIIDLTFSQTINRSVFSCSYNQANDSIAVVAGQSQNITGIDQFDKIGFFPFQTSLLGLTEISTIHILIYPNPATDFVIFQNSFSEFALLTFMSLTGEILPVDYSITGNTAKANLSDLASGVYCVHIQLLDGHMIANQLIVN